MRLPPERIEAMREYFRKSGVYILERYLKNFCGITTSIDLITEEHAREAVAMLPEFKRLMASLDEQDARNRRKAA